MDHLLLPPNPTSPLPRVPHVCSTYDGGDFLTYPVRAGGDWHRVLPTADSPPFWIRELAQPIDDAQLESFFQCWLFFGVLHELFHPQGRYNAADYLEQDEEGKFVHTRNLASTLREWCEHVHILDEQEKIHLKRRLILCIRLAYDVLSCLSASKDEPSHGHPKFSRPIRASILSVCELIAMAGEVSLDVLPDEDFPYFSRFATFNSEEKAHMKRSGWCPSLIANEEGNYTSMALFVYLQHMPQPRLDLDHSKCSLDECRNIQIDVETYAPSHTPDCAGATCRDVGPHLDAVAACLDAGNFPVLDIVINAGNEVSLIVRPYHAGMAYVALSHVWVDGLGNPSALTLPACQIRRLQAELQIISGQTFTWLEAGQERRRKAPEHLYLWCDSLLCPIQVQPMNPAGLTGEERTMFDSSPVVQRSRWLKNAALSHMRDVYTKATYVLVLDSGLETLPVLDSAPVHAAAHLVTSRWVQRLWTYQEAALPTKLLIKSADSIIDYRDLMLQMIPLRDDPISRGMCHVIFGRCRELRSHQSARSRGGPNVRELQRGIRTRGVTYPSDEPLCAGTILGLDLGRIADGVTGESRMAVLWDLVCESQHGVPDNIIFNKSPRLIEAGFRWAPSSFRQRMTEAYRPLADSGSQRRARLTSTGLHVLYSGWQLEMTAPVWGATGQDWRSLRGAANLLHVRQPDGTWYRISKATSGSSELTSEQPLWALMRNSLHGEWAIIIDNDEIFGSTESREAVLGTFQVNDSGLSVFASQILVVVAPLQPRYVTIMTIAEEHAKQLQHSSALTWYQLCFAVDRVATVCEQRLPNWLRWTLLLLFRTLIYWVSRLPFYLLMRRLTKRGQRSAQSTIVAEAMERATAETLAGHIGLFLTGGTAVVTQLYGPEHEWCVQ